MKYIIKIVFIIFISVQSFAQNVKPAYSLCEKTGDCSMTWDEFKECKKQLLTVDKTSSISSFRLTIKKAEKRGKDSTFTEFSEKGNMISRSSMEVIEKLHTDKKLGNKLLIDNVEVVQSGKAAKKASAMVIILN